MSSIWSNKQKPRRVLGRRSMGMRSSMNFNSTINNDLNSLGLGTRKSLNFNNTTLNGDLKSNPTFYEPSCASTPLHDVNINKMKDMKENIFLSSIKPARTPSSAGKHIRTSPRQSPGSSIPGVTSSIKKPKFSNHIPGSRPAPYQRRLGRRSVARSDLENSSLVHTVNYIQNVNTSLNLTPKKDKGDAKPATESNLVGGSSLNFLSEKYDLFKRYITQSMAESAPAPAPKEPADQVPNEPTPSPFKFESNFKCESIQESDESNEPEGGLISKSNISMKFPKQEMSTEDCHKNGSLLEDMDSNPSMTIELTVVERDENVNRTIDIITDKELVSDETLENQTEPELFKDNAMSSCSSSEQLNRTFEILEEEEAEDDDMVFKTPAASKIMPANESAVFKTPMSLIRSKFHQDAEDSFVENEKTLMLQFKNETLNQFTGVVKETTKDLTPPVQPTPLNSNFSSGVPKVEVTNVDDVNNKVEEHIALLTMKLENELEKNLQALLISQKQIIKNQMEALKQSLLTDSGLGLQLIKSKSNLKEKNELCSATIQETTGNEDYLKTKEEVPEKKARQSIAFSNFKKNCSILKTPIQSKVVPKTSNLFTPRSLSICIKDQLEALESS